ncbi:LIP-domain-containing protein [Apiospora arundinis]
MASVFQITTLLVYLNFVLGQVEVPSERRNRFPRTSLQSKQITRDEASRIEIQIALKQPKAESAADHLLKISDPASPHYGKHWSAREVAVEFSPKPHHKSAVTQWLRTSGISSREISFSKGGGHVVVNLDRKMVETLFDTQCYDVDSSHGAGVRMECSSYTVPSSVASVIDYVSAAEKATQASTIHRRAILGPSVGSPLYQLKKSHMTWLPDDLDHFFGRFQPELVGRRPIVEPIVGGFRQTTFNISAFNLEPNLDFQYTMALTGNQNVTNLQVGDEFLGGNVNNMLAAFDKFYCGALDPSVDAIYPDSRPGGYNGSDCGTVTPPKSGFHFLQLARGGLFLELPGAPVPGIPQTGPHGGGDTGTQSGISGGTCLDPATGHNATSKTGRFSPQWPSSCPWITSVGGTQKQRAAAPSKANNTELGSSREEAFRYIGTIDNVTYTSSGGFSNNFAAPAYQRDAVSAYKQLQGEHLSRLEASGHYADSGGRGYPDVSLLASSYVISLYGRLTSIYGTSGSAPVFASMITLINNERLKLSKPTLGFLNPALYANSQAFNDVVVGGNEGCGAKPAFKAIPGWDAVTGLGSPDYERLLGLLIDVP